MSKPVRHASSARAVLVDVLVVLGALGCTTTSANDMTHSATLIALTGHTNESKGDSTPDQWRPPDARSWCRYARDWISVKATWRLTVTPPERRALVAMLGTCP